MAISEIPANVATNAMQAIPFGTMIGGPLKACIDAQAMAAQASWEFIQKVGLNTNPETGEREAINVSFSFNQGGRMVQLNVPLLTIVPIPYIAINTIDINFKANISASSSSVTETSTSKASDVNVDAKAKLKIPFVKVNADIKANYSTKKDSKATEESKYSVESTIDVAVHAGQESMPAGLAKVLDLLGNSLDVSDVLGTLEANAYILAPGERLIVTYKNKDGLYEPKAIKSVSGDETLEVEDTYAFCDGLQTGVHKFSAGGREITVKVEEGSANSEGTE